MFAGIEGRGTRFTALLGPSPGEVAARFDVPATGPAETLDAVTRFIADRAGDDLRGVGIACFGPLDYARGTVTYTLKPGWQDFPIVDTVRDALGVPVVLDTDVNAAAVAEGAARGIEDLLFVTIGSGTGIGAGALVAGAPVHGRTHPEMGHLPVRRHPDDSLEGLCPYHRDCLEGLATAKAMATRWGVPAEESPAEGVALEAFYLAQLVAAATYMLSPQLVVIDGALAAVPSLIPAVREAVDARLAGDPAVRAIAEDLTDYIQPSALDGDAAALGALRLAAQPAP